MPWLLGGIQTNELPESILHFAPKARQGMYKVSVDGAPTLRPPESVWLDNLSILTPYRNIREVSCWKILNGSFDRMLFLRSLQRSMTKIQTLECIGAFDLVSFSLTMCVFELIRASGALQKKKIISVRQFQPPCFWCNGTRTQNQSMAQWLGWFRIHWLEYIIPETAFRRQWRHISIEKKKPKFHSAAWGAPQIQNQAYSRIFSMQLAQTWVFFWNRMELGTPILFRRSKSTDQVAQEQSKPGESQG